MRYVKYVPKTDQKDDPFIGILAQEFWFFYMPELVDLVLVSCIHTKKVILNYRGVNVKGVTTEKLKVIDVKGKVIEQITPQQIGNRVYYPFNEIQLGEKIMILKFPRELKIKPLKLKG